MALHEHRSATVWLIAILAAVLLSSAATGGTVVTKKYSGLDPLSITYDPDPRSDGAQRTSEAMRVTVSSLIRPSPQDRHLEIVLYVSEYGQPSIAYRQRVTLPEGASSESASFVYVNPLGYGRWLLDVLENGNSIVQPSPSINSLNSAQFASQHWCCVVNPPGNSNVGLPFHYDYTTGTMFVDNVSLKDGASDWRFYLRYSLVIWPIELLQQATQEQCQALSTYASCGGSVIIHVPKWQNDYRHDLVHVDRALSDERVIDAADYRWRSWPDTDGANGFQRSHGGGQIVALRDAPSNIHRHLEASGIHYPVSSIIAGDLTDEEWFWRNLVETVGKTPVWTFSGLVVLFLALVGPGLLVVTGRLRHRTLLLLLIPACSLILTLGILSYNLLREGNVTRGRIVSLQYFDAHTGQGAAWSRQTYFCGFPPRNGLSYPKEALLKPAKIAGSNNSLHDPRRGVMAEICFEQDSQLVKRWLLPNSQQQILVGQRLKGRSLPFAVTKHSEDQIRFTNSSDETLQLAIVKGPDEELYLAEDIPAQETIDLKPLSASAVDSLRSTNRHKWLPEIPPEIDPLARRFRRSRWYYGSSSIESDSFVDVLKITPVLEKLPPYGYLVITPSSNALETPFPESIFDKERNLHVLMGACPWQSP